MNTSPNTSGEHKPNLSLQAPADAVSPSCVAMRPTRATRKPTIQQKALLISSRAS
eukprot:XP_001699917.1 predicted protein [Chlamydomonas reinhardtii]